jgi:CHAT domain-containing protein
MKELPSFQAYRNRADELRRGQINEGELRETASQLPGLDEDLLEQLASFAETAALSDPRQGWAIAQTADSAARDRDLLIRSRAAWYLGRAYNHWGQPQQAAAVLSRAYEGFETLNETGWMAACRWQSNHLAWTKPNIGETTRQLEAALDGLERAGLEVFTPHCRLSLSYAQILIGDFAGAQANLEICAAGFTVQQDFINLARCWYNEASCLRRQHHFDAAYAKLEQALETFRRGQAPIEAAKTHYQLALWYFLSGKSYPKAVEYFEQAADVFSSHGMDLWAGVCQNGLAQIDIQNGDLSKASQELQRARASFVEHGISNLLADNHNDSGQLELMLGDLAASREHFTQAEKIYSSAGWEFPAANALANRGNVSALLGRFQEALNDLELAENRFQKLDSPGGRASCEIYLARIWANLNQYATAHEHLQQAESLYQQNKQQAMLGFIYNQRALIFALEGRLDEAVAALKAALEISREFGMAPQTALAERRLGEMLSRSGQLAEARGWITSAEAKFHEMGMSIEQADSLTALGDYYTRVSASQEAEKTYQAALALCQGVVPEIETRIYTGLAVLAEGGGEPVTALGHYRQAVKALAQLRHSFWQPALAGSYLRASSTTLDQAVRLASKLQAGDDVLNFIESSKAQSLVRQIAASTFALVSDVPAEISALWLQIQTLQTQLRAIYDPNPWSRASGEMKALQEKLVTAVQHYDRRLAELERKAAGPISGPHSAFDLVRFREAACARWGRSWLALDYYLTGETVVCLMLTAEGLTVRETGLSNRGRMALEVCARSHQGASSISPADLKVLGDLLLPPEMQAQLASVDTPVVIIPHRELHSLPWAALRPGWTTQALVELCVPTIVPSLQLLQLIWQRAGKKEASDRTAGLLLGISDFQGRRPALPFTVQEIESISAEAHHHSLALLEAEATWERLVGLCGKTTGRDRGLSAFAFFHLASHVNHDSRTGRLSSLALYDQEIALDRFRELAPLPELVSLSACNGTQSLVYAGDEHVGLATTCLIAGASVVIGSLWPVLDSAAAANMTRFYRGFFSELSPAAALAQAQRAAIQNGESLQNWASFLCLGA